MSDDIRLVNAWDQCRAAGGDRIIISFSGDGCGNEWVVHRWVDGEEVSTDPKAHWSRYGRKAFSPFSLGGKFHERKAGALANAIKWVSETYGKSDFVRNRAGDYVEAEVNQKWPLPPRPRKVKPQGS